MSLPARRFVPSNPGGKPGRHRGQKMVDWIGTATKDGELMASFFVRVLKGIEKGSNVSHKIRAAEWLADRYAGKAVEIALTGDIDSASNPLAELDAEQLRALIHKIVPRQNHQKSESAPTSEAKIGEPPTSTDITQPAETTYISSPSPTSADMSDMAKPAESQQQ